MTRLLLLAAALAAAARPADAAFVRSVMDRVDTEPLFDSEYFHDLRAFSWGRAWEEPWAAAPGGVRVAGASLDCCDLFLDAGALVARRLTKGLEFRFRYEELSDKDRQESHHWLELEQDLAGGVSVEVFGDPTFRKEDADAGVGLRWRRGAWQARARRTAVDFNFNHRGSTTERYSLEPWTDELEVRAPLGSWKARAGAEVDEPTRREVPDERRAFFYRRARAYAAAGTDDGWAPLVEYSFERQRKASTVAPGGTGSSEESGRFAHALSVSARLRPAERDELEPGAAWLTRSARADFPGSPASAVRYRRWEVQPWLRWRRRLSSLLVSELMPTLSCGENRVVHPGGGAPDRLERIVEAKLGSTLEFHFSPTARIGLTGTWDLDEPGKPWDGGSGRVMVLF